MKNNSFIIQSKNNNLIKKSSSGGMFAELAKFVLSKNGVVFGCSMERVEDGFDVKHIYIENEKDLYKLQGSKYVQSRIGNTIKEAKEFLDKGRFVLYSGTPCQIAGLKAYLKQDYDNLLTVDLSCEGTPPLAIFNDYIRFLETEVLKTKIIDFKFRSKKHFGWSTSGFVAIYKKGNKIKEKILPQNLSSYFSYFLSGSILQERCFSCKFTGLKRQSDITIADAWGIDREYPELIKKNFNKNRGISLVLINSTKGNTIFEKLKLNLISSEIDINRLRKYNHPFRHPSIKPINKEAIIKIYKNDGYKGVESKFKHDLGNKYYYFVLKNHTPQFIKNIIKFFKPKQEDFLLMTLYCLSNYGSLLTAFALYKTLTNLGYKGRLINYGNFGGFGKAFIRKYLPLTKRCLNKDDFSKLNDITNTFILGADNLINLAVSELDWVSRNLFNFVSNDKKRLMISGSIGEWDGTTQNKQEHNYIKYLLDKFNSVSTREEHGKDVFENVFGVNADWVNDPVFYLQKDDFVELTRNIKEDYSNKIMQYVLYPTSETKKIVEYTKKNMGLDTIKFDGNDNVKYFSNSKNKSVENWLKAILESKLVITDSFHCVAFCLIFNKDFVCIKNTHATVRFLSLFKRLGIQILLIETVKDLQSADLSYNKDVVNKSLNDIREFALAKIQEYLLKPNKIIIPNPAMEEYNRAFIKNNEVWYKKNRLFYFGIIVPFVIPIKRLWADIKNG